MSKLETRTTTQTETNKQKPSKKALKLLAHFSAALALATAGAACKSEAEKAPPPSPPAVTTTVEPTAPPISITPINTDFNRLYDQFLSEYHSLDFDAESIQIRIKLLQELAQEASEGALKKYSHIPKVAELLAYLQNEGLYTVAINHMSTIAQSKKEDSAPEAESFELVYMPDNFPIPAEVVVQNQGRTIRINADFQHQEWLALALAHGLSLSYDYVKEVQETTPREKEIKAYLVEIKILRETSPSTYEYLLEQGIPRMKAITENAGSLSDIAGFCQQTYNLQAPEITEAERRIGTSVCALALLYAATLDQDPTQGDLTDEQIQQLIYAMQLATM